MREYIIDGINANKAVKVGIAKGTPISIHMFEIIGTLVKEGSKEWALYQMMQGEKVCNPTLAAEKATRLGCDDETFNTFWYIVGDAVVEGEGKYGTLSVSSWVAAAYSTGWQIYKEPEPQYKVGDWVEFIDVGGRKSQGKYLSNTDGNAIIVLDTTCNMRVVVHTTKIIRKLPHSEVEVDFGFAKGRILSRMSGYVKVLNNKSIVIATIIVSEITNPETRELVESLLKAQEEK